MTADPVREALRAAAQALERFSLDSDDPIPSYQAEPYAAAAVAAFLRSISEQCDGGSVTLDCGQPCGPHTMANTLPLEWLAAAVERAAREAGE